MIPNLFRFTLFILLAMAGCKEDAKTSDRSEPPIEVVPVSGTVTYGGEPLANATVLFVPTDYDTNKRSVVGWTDANGKYKLNSIPDDGNKYDGALPGVYEVKFSRATLPDGTVLKPGTALSDPHTVIREGIPTDYSLRFAFTVEVSPGKRNGYDFALEKKD